MSENKLDIKKTLFLSFGFFASMILWSVYNAFVPRILDEYFGISFFLIGVIMSIDNFFGVVFQPLFGKLSDRTRTRFGRRMPFLLIGIPVSVLLFVFIPHMTYQLWSFMAVVIIFTFMMGVWRTPAVSLMPDLIPGPFRSQANGIVNLVGGVGAVIAFLGGGILFGLGGFPLPFLVSGIIALLSLAILIIFVREPIYPPLLSKEEAKKTEIKLSAQERKSCILILSAIFFWFMGYNAIETFFSLYAGAVLDLDAGQASISLGVIGIGVILFAFPSGLLGAKIGRRNVIFIGLAGMIVLFVPMIFITNFWIVHVILFFSGVFWACININSLPMIVRISGPAKIGLFIGYYYLFSFSSQLITTPLYGFILDMSKHYCSYCKPLYQYYESVYNYSCECLYFHQSLWIYAIVTYVLACICLLFVRHGEEEPQTS
ncbi:MAG: MFS transporter [Spirochaetes bacterium]|nr:MFS transporter [Spirochaetota bacterium]